MPEPPRSSFLNSARISAASSRQYLASLAEIFLKSDDASYFSVNSISRSVRILDNAGIAKTGWLESEFIPSVMLEGSLHSCGIFSKFVSRFLEAIAFQSSVAMPKTCKSNKQQFCLTVLRCDSGRSSVQKSLPRTIQHSSIGCQTIYEILFLIYIECYSHNIMVQYS